MLLEKLDEAPVLGAELRARDVFNLVVSGAKLERLDTDCAWGCRTFEYYLKGDSFISRSE